MRSDSRCRSTACAQQVVACCPTASTIRSCQAWRSGRRSTLQTPARNQWGNHYLSVIGRLRPGATLEQAQAEIVTIAARIERQLRRQQRPAIGARDAAAGRHGRHRRRLLWMLLGAVGLLLTIACVNVAGLVLARGAARAQELAVRAALGCSRWRLARQLVLESVLALARRRPRRPRQRAGGDAPAPGGRAGVGRARRGGNERRRRRVRVRLRRRARRRARASASCRRCSTRGRTSKACCANQDAARPAAAARRASGRCSSSARSRSRSCCSPAPACSCAASSSCRRSISGCAPAHVLTFQVNLPAGRYAEPERRAAFHVAFQDRLAAIPGVRRPARCRACRSPARITPGPPGAPTSPDADVLGRPACRRGPLLRGARDSRASRTRRSTPRTARRRGRSSSTIDSRARSIRTRIRSAAGCALSRRRGRDHRRRRRRRQWRARADAGDRLSPAPPVRRESQLGAHRGRGVEPASGAPARRHPARAPRTRSRARPPSAAHAHRRHRPRHRAGTLRAAGRRGLRRCLR